MLDLTVKGRCPECGALFANPDPDRLAFTVERHLAYSHGVEPEGMR